jgi:hypothetical protein
MHTRNLGVEEEEWREEGREGAESRLRRNVLAHTYFVYRAVGGRGARMCFRDLYISKVCL